MMVTNTSSSLQNNEWRIYSLKFYYVYVNFTTSIFWRIFNATLVKNSWRAPFAGPVVLKRLDPSGELLTIYLDVTLPALHQEAIVSREEVYQSARKAKAEAYPRKDSAGRLLSETCCVPFILTSTGGLCQEGHDFLRLCKKRNKSATLRLLDVLATQHAKWTARRIRRALFGQSMDDFSGSTWSYIKIRGLEPEGKTVNRRKKQTSRIEQEFSQVVSQVSSEECTSCIDEGDSLIPGMASYHSQSVGHVDFSEAGTATGGVFLSTSATPHAEHSLSLDRAQRSTDISRNFSPATR